MLKITDPITNIKGIGPKKEQLLNSLGIFNIYDLITYYPRTYEDQSGYTKLLNAINNEKASFIVKVIGKLPTRYLKNRMTLTAFVIEDSSYEGEMVFFNNRYVEKSIEIGKTYFIYGKATWYKNKISVNSPKFELWENKKKENLIIPIYPLKKGVKNNEIIKYINQGLKSISLVEENLPEDILNRYGLLDKRKAILNIHNPRDMEILKSAKKRLIFEELLLFQLALFLIKNQDRQSLAIEFKEKEEIYDLIKKLPYKLTSGQEKTLNEVIENMKKPIKMNRLIQGDVGSGKTIIAIIAMYLTVLNGYQATIMVPTEVLAKQHLKAIRETLDIYGIHSELLVGSLTPKKKSIVLEKLKNGEIDILVGTHALIEENVQFNRLGLTITDEQHRFGVNQRKAFMSKQEYSDTLVMTATPIPRTLALILYGDLDISIIDNMPEGRIPVNTVAINEQLLDRALNFIKEEVSQGRQAYIICPLIEDSEVLNLNSAMSIYENLKENYYSDYKVELLHGKMTPSEKTDIMEKFERNEIQVLISTTVIEVGINVPNASVILIYNAERFGLAQLHQLRGRVGRGKHKSYCILYNESTSKLSWDRMKVMQNSTDGFFIAEKDLKLRGEGDIMGTRQHGLPELKIAQLDRDMNILKYAQIEALRIIRENPNLDNKKYRIIKENIRELFSFSKF